MVILQVGFCYALHVGAVAWAAVVAAVAVPLGGWRMRMTWMYGPSCTALPRIGSDCSTHPVWQHNDESRWAARIRVCCWLLFLMLVKVLLVHVHDIT